MFKRLNTGGSDISPQEIRNCSVRMLGDAGVQFYGVLTDLAASESFVATTSTLSASDFEQKANEELVLRFFAAKNYRQNFRGSVRDWLDDYMEAVLLGQIPFERDREVQDFIGTLRLVHDALGESAFVKFRGNSPLGGLAPAYFEAIAIGFYESFVRDQAAIPNDARQRLIDLVQADAFRDVTGPGANSKTKLEKRIRLVSEALQ